ncbi:hypothetical protein Tco_1481372, partial [Tanacetum coccineum]
PFVSAGRSLVSTDRSNTPNVSTASTSIGANADESSFVYLGGKIPIDASTLPNADLPIDPNMPDLEDASDTLPNDGIFNGAYDDEAVGAVADFNNMDNTIAIKDWDTIRAKLEVNAKLSKDVLGQDLPEQDFAKRMVDMVNQRKKHFAEERAKAKRNKPMTQSQLRIYMSNYLKNQGTWKLSQLKKLKFEEIKEEFDKIDDKDVPAIGEKVAEVKEEEQVKRTGKRKKQKARKGINVNKSAQEDSKTDKEESVEAMNPTPLTTKSDIYMSFGAMIKDFTREDLIELYRLVMQKYGTNMPEDAIWSLPLQQKMVSWRYYDKCEVHCLTLEACTIYMLADRKYPLSKEACQVMLKMKLLDGKMNEVCYKLLKMIEKQAGVRK